MQSINQQRLSEADMLTRAVENVLRKLIRFLVGRISLVRLQEMIRYIYVDEAMKNLKRERPGKNVALTQLALFTGLDTRTLTQVRIRLEQESPQYRQQYLKELTPESAVVEAWADRVATADAKEEAAVMAYGSDDSDFERLVRSTISTRGITSQSIIRRLVDTRSVEQDKERRTLKLVVDHFSPYLSDDEPSIINAAFSAVSNLMSTIEYNVKASRDDKLFQRQAWTFRLHPDDRLRFRTACRAMLEQFEAKARRDIRPWEGDEYGSFMMTAGVGLYYFEES